MGGVGTLRTLLALALALLPTACEEAERVEPSQAPSYVVLSTRIDLPELRLSSPTAFAFAPRADGATLLWSPPGEHKEIRRLRLSRGGNPLGGTARVVRDTAKGGTVTDLVAARVGDGLAVAWVERLQNEARIQAALADGGSDASVFDLGPAWHTAKTVRGNVAVAADGDRALVFARGQSERCVSPGERECFGFGLYRIGAETSQPRGLPLSVPVPCERHSAHLSVAGGGWFYGVCTVSDGERVTTLFDIRFNPEYARAERLLPGCEPLGIVTRGKTPWLVGRCGDKQSGVKLGEEGATPVEFAPAALDCLGRKLLLKHGQRVEPLERGRTDLAPLLPTELTRRLEQVVYTGNSLLFARAEGNSLSLVRHACVVKADARDN